MFGGRDQGQRSVWFQMKVGSVHRIDYASNLMPAGLLDKIYGYLFGLESTRLDFRPRGPSPKYRSSYDTKNTVQFPHSGATRSRNWIGLVFDDIGKCTVKKVEITVEPQGWLCEV